MAVNTSLRTFSRIGMKPQRMTVISIDGLGADWLGPYGNSLIALPALDRFAAQSLVCESHAASSIDLAQTCAEWWSTRAPAAVNLPAAALAAGYRSILVTDDESLTKLPAAQGFDEHLLCRTALPTRAAREADATSLAHTLSEATSLLSDTTPIFLWIHTRGLYAPWDAPYEFRARFAGAEEEPPGDFLDPPDRANVSHGDDAILEAIHAYAGQIASLNDSLARLFEAASGEDSLTVFTAPRGYPLGEHGALGASGLALRGPSLHVPLIVRYPQGEHRLSRFAGLSETADLCDTLAASLGLDIPAPGDLARRADQSIPSGELLFARENGTLAIRSRAWFARLSGEQAELYIKPADRWEANDIASRCEPIVEEFRRLGESFLSGGDRAAVAADVSEAIDLGWK